MRQVIRQAMVRELRRQANEDRAGTPYFDPDDGAVAIIDGEVDLEKLAAAIAEAIEETPLYEKTRAVVEVLDWPLAAGYDSPDDEAMLRQVKDRIAELAAVLPSPAP